MADHKKSIFDTGKAQGVVALANMSGSSATSGVGAAAGLDGEITVLAPGIKDKDVKNAIHIHMVTLDGKSAGHTDDVALSNGMKLLLPNVAGH